MRYDFICKSCSERFEVVCKVDDKGKQKCPKCRSKKLKQIYHSPYAEYKGTDFTLSVTKGGE